MNPLWLFSGLTLPKKGPRPRMTVAAISVSHQKKTRDEAPGTGFWRVPLGPEGWTTVCPEHQVL